MGEDVASGLDGGDVGGVVEHLEHDGAVGLALGVLMDFELGQT